MDIIAQLQRRYEAKLRLVPLNSPDERLDEPVNVKVNPHKTLCMLHMGVPFNFPLEDLRDAWSVATPEEQELIEHIVNLRHKELVA